MFPRDVNKCTSSGSSLPFNSRRPSGVVTASGSRALVSGPIATAPGGAWPSIREAMLTVSPTIVWVRPPAAPNKLTETSPELIPTRNRGHFGFRFDRIGQIHVVPVSFSA